MGGIFQNEGLFEQLVVPLLILLGWPAVAASIILSIAGMVSRRSRLLYASAALYLPFAVYLYGTPRFGFYGFLLPISPLAAAFALRKNQPWLGWLALSPIAIVSCWIAAGVIWQVRQ